MDLLISCASAYQTLMNYEYHFVIARKGRLKEFILNFSETDFHHLAGLHKLKDLSIARANRNIIFRQIFKGQLTYASLTKSQLLPKIQSRLQALPTLENMLDGEQQIFRYNRHIYPYSSIESEFLIKMGEETIFGTTFLFLDQSKNGLYFCRSFFPIDRTDYTIGQMRYTLLKKVKHNLKTGQDIVIFSK